MRSVPRRGCTALQPPPLSAPQARVGGWAVLLGYHRLAQPHAGRPRCNRPRCAFFQSSGSRPPPHANACTGLGVSRATRLNVYAHAAISAELRGTPGAVAHAPSARSRLAVGVYRGVYSVAHARAAWVTATAMATTDKPNRAGARKRHVHHTSRGSNPRAGLYQWCWVVLLHQVGVGVAEATHDEVGRAHGNRRWLRRSDREEIYFFFGAACDRAVREGWVGGRRERRRSWGCVVEA